MADSTTLFTLLEIAAGYVLFEVVAFEEIGALLEGSMDTVTELERFGRAIKLKAFQPFESAEDALENANAISEHAMTDSLKAFLEMNLPKISKKKKEGKAAAFSLGIVDPSLATAINEGIPGMSCRSDDTVREILRGCRLHLTRFVKGLDGGSAEQAQLGLGHSYSRGKVKFNPARSDNMVIQSIALLDQMDKDLNTFAMRVREWYSWHFPELKDIVKDNYMFARCAAYIQEKSSLFTQSNAAEDDDDDDDESKGEEAKEDKIPGLIEIVGEPELANAIVSAAKTSMGVDCSAVDMINIINFTQRMVKLAEFRKKLAIYMTDKMAIVAPNLSTLIGDTVAARLISKAGSLTNLAKAPASTVQILGAEKALFRALKTKGNTPKYGLIYHSTFIGRADAKNKGRISRYLANKCSIASRIDSFSDEPTSAYGLKLKEQVEERLRFYETGAAPRKNIDVMAEVAKHLKAGKDGDEEMEDVATTPKKSKKEKKEKKSEKKSSKKRKDSSSDEGEPSNEVPKSEKKSAKKSAKKAKKSEDEEVTPIKEDKAPKSEKKSSKKSKKDGESEKTPPKEAKTPKSEKKSSKKKRRKSKD